MHPTENHVEDTELLSVERNTEPEYGEGIYHVIIAIEGKEYGVFIQERDCIFNPST